MLLAVPGKQAAPAGAFVGAAIVCFMLCLGALPQAVAQTKAQAQNVPPPVPVEQGARWQALSVEQRSALRPLERDWGGISANQKQKWLEIAARFPTLPSDEKARIQGRMSDWAKLTTEQRSAARINFQQAKEVSPRDRQAQWEAYQSLPAEERLKLAARAAPAPAPTTSFDAGRKSERSALTDRSGRDAQQGKSNIVPNPAFAVQPKPVAPTVQQAQPGATTTLISKRPVPPPHQQTGLPKIAASPNFVDKATLLPQRGPQGAATQSASASAAEASQRR